MNTQFDLDIFGGQTRTKYRRKGKKQLKSIHSWKYLGLVSDLGVALAVPIAGGALLGSFVDKKFSTYPKATLVFLLVGIAVSGFNFFTTVRRVMTDHERTEN